MIRGVWIDLSLQLHSFVTGIICGICSLTMMDYRYNQDDYWTDANKVAYILGRKDALPGIRAVTIKNGVDMEFPGHQWPHGIKQNQAETWIDYVWFKYGKYENR
jgi:hypothetical protein